MKKKKLVFILLLIICLALFFLWQGIYLPKDSKSSQEMVLYIEKGQNLFQIAENLEREGLIKNKFFFDFYIILKRKEKKLQAGGYSLSPSMNIVKIAQKIASGDVIKEKIAITIIEGWNKKEIANYLEERGIIQSKDFLEKLKYSQWEDQYDFLKDRPDSNFYDRRNRGQEDWDIEGYLFPDTYYIKGLEEIVKRMLENFDKKLTPELRKEISSQGKTIFEIVTMASMIEKEVKNSEDKKLVSGILWKRLENNIPLQVDATITYITGKKMVQPSLEDLQIDSPYNTYKYKGLPLGPISNPGLDSILAAVYPEESQYWYYLSTPEGETIFSKTLQEHNLAKAKYLR